MPGLEERIDIVRAVARNLRLAPSVLDPTAERKSLHEIARRTEDYSGADLQAVMYNAQLEAVHDMLGDEMHELDVQPSQNEGRKTMSSAAKLEKAKKRVPEFMHFRYGDDQHPLSADDGEKSSPLSLSPSASTERAVIASKIAELQSTRRKAKQLRHQQRYTALVTHPVKEDATSKLEPEVQWRHVEGSLAITRSSVSKQERRRLASIYREFLVGRTGELPSGQGGSEIGGRTSLM